MKSDFNRIGFDTIKESNVKLLNSISLELEVHMAKNIKKDIIHAKGFDIGIYTTDYEKEFISFTDIAKYRRKNIEAMILMT